MIVATALANGLAEEVFFRGALYESLDADQAVVARRPSTPWPPSRPGTPP
ncbi:MAG: CPBP family intramembrane glutamic endopeptidase [Nocardioidaceae bacterium]